MYICNSCCIVIFICEIQNLWEQSSSSSSSSASSFSPSMVFMVSEQQDQHLQILLCSIKQTWDSVDWDHQQIRSNSASSISSFGSSVFSFHTSEFSHIRSRKPVIWSPYSIFSFLRSLYFIHLWSFFFIIWIWFSWLLLLPFLHPLLFLLFLISNIGSMISVKLENRNYLLWKSQFLHALRANHVDGFVDGTFWSISTWISVRFRWKFHKRDKSRLSCFGPARLECPMLDQCHSL